jgi:hypothetical protein
VGGLDVRGRRRGLDVVAFPAGRRGVRGPGRPARGRGRELRGQPAAPAGGRAPLRFDGDRTGFTLGGSWQQGAWRIDAAGALVQSKARSTGGTSLEGYEGTYKTRAGSAALSIGYAF